MSSKNPEIDRYLKQGCGRCPLGGTPECKVHGWNKELQLLRKIVLACGLKEELKWSVPCYTFAGHNISIVSALKGAATISFFKGALLDDPNRLLEKPGDNSQAARLIRFTTLEAVRELEPDIKALILAAIEVEKRGLKFEFKAKDELVIPQELELMLNALPALRAAWERLTPGRQRGYVLYFSGAKQTQTRTTRIEKYIPLILEGRGIHD